MNEEHEGGVSFSDIVRVVWKRFWIVLVASVATALIAALVVGLAVNPMRTTYSMEFHIVFPLSETDKYPDGSPFYYYNIVSSDFLNEAKSSDAAFSSVDIDRMIEKEDVGISAVQDANTSATVYTLTVRGSYFSGKDVAEKFLQAAADVAANRIRENAASVDFGLKEEIFEAASYGKKLQLLTEWKQTMKSAYERWISMYSETYTVNGKTLQNYLSVLETIFDENTQKGLTDALTTYGYDELDVSGFGTLEEAIAARRELLDAELKTNEEIILQLEKYMQKIEEDADSPSGEAYSFAAVQLAPAARSDEGEPSSTTIKIESSDYMSISQMIAHYTRRNTLIESRIKPALESEIIEKFVGRIQSQYEDLTSAAQTLSEVTSSVYGQETYTNFTSQKAQTNNRMNVVFMAGVGFVLAFIISFAVVYVVRRPSKRKKGAEQPVGQTDGHSEE